MNLDGVRIAAREKLERGDLPREKCLITWFGPGSGQSCVVCATIIEQADVECECEHPRGNVIRFHQTCFTAWDGERQALGV